MLYRIKYRKWPGQDPLHYGASIKIKCLNCHRSLICGPTSGTTNTGLKSIRTKFWERMDIEDVKRIHKHIIAERLTRDKLIEPEYKTETDSSTSLPTIGGHIALPRINQKNYHLLHPEIKPETDKSSDGQKSDSDTLPKITLKDMIIQAFTSTHSSHSHGSSEADKECEEKNIAAFDNTPMASTSNSSSFLTTGVSTQVTKESTSQSSSSQPSSAGSSTSTTSSTKSSSKTGNPTTDFPSSTYKKRLQIQHKLFFQDLKEGALKYFPKICDPRYKRIPCALSTLKMFDESKNFASIAHQRRICRQDYLNLTYKIGNEAAFIVLYKEKNPSKFIDEGTCKRHTYFYMPNVSFMGYCIYCRVLKEFCVTPHTACEQEAHRWTRHGTSKSNLTCLNCLRLDPTVPIKHDLDDFAMPWTPEREKILDQAIKGEAKPQFISLEEKFNISRNSTQSNSS